MSRTYNKLVRDNIPAIIEAEGLIARTRILNENEYVEELIRKLKEEVEEFTETPNTEELSDIVEVLEALRLAMGISPKTLEAARKRKADKNGKFQKRIYLESVE